MPRSRLKLLRLVLGCGMLAALTAVFVDLRGNLPVPIVHALAAAQFVPAWLAASAASAGLVVFLGIVAVTLVGGRIYCSTICPLGLLQDAVARVGGWLQPARRPLRFVRGSRWVRYGMLIAVVLTISLGGGGIAYAQADPYSHFGRILSALVRPVVGIVNNALVPAATALGWSGLNQVTVTWPTPGILVGTTFMLALVTGLALWRRRILCNTLCPVGTVLGGLARFSAFQLTIDAAACHKCARCLQGCKSQCINLRDRSVDSSRCVACFNCLNECDRQAVHYEFRWRRTAARRNGVAGLAEPGPGSATRATTPAMIPSASRTSTTCLDRGRRAFLAELGSAVAGLTGAAALVAVARADEHADASNAGHHERAHSDGHAARAICPPGAGSVDRFLARCTGCNLCVSACPTHVLQPAFREYGFAGMMKPRLDYTTAFCNFDCHRCGDVCPDGALLPLALEAKHVTRIGEAHLDIDQCIVKTKGTDCAACSEHCPTKALDTKPYGENLRLPYLQSEACIGCGACEYACPASPIKAVRVTGEREHRIARPPRSEAAPAPQATGDFPF